jgi:hypothetical protein
MTPRRYFFTRTLVLIALLSCGANLGAQTRNPAINAGTKQSRKMEKQQAKAMKKYQKAQRKAQKKMIKTDRKNTHDPYRPK